MKKKYPAGQRVFEASSLAEIDKEAIASLEINTVLEHIVQRSYELLEGNTVALFMRLGDEPELLYSNAVGLYAEELKSDAVLIGRGILGTIAGTGKSEIINDANADPRAVEIKGTPISESPEKIMVSPLVAYGRVIGVLGIWRHGDKRNFERTELGMLEEFAAQAVMAVENARLYSDAQQRITQLSMLTEIGRILASAIGLNELLDAVHVQMSRIFDTTNFFIVIYREGEPYWEQRLTIEHGKRLPTERHSLGRGVTGHILRNRISVLLQSRDAWDEFHRERGMTGLGEEPQSWMGVPLIAGDRIHGVMVIQNYETPKLYGPQDLELFSLIGTQVAIAIQNTRLYDDAKRRADEMSALVDCGTDVTASLKLQTVLERIAARAHSMLSRCATAVYLADPSTKDLRAVVAVGDNSDLLLTGEISLDTGVVRSVADSGIAKIGTDSSRLKSAKRSADTEPGGASAAEKLLAMPMMEHGTVIGVLAVWRGMAEPAFDGFDIAFSAGLARQAAVAISNARAFERAQAAQAEAEAANLLKSQFLANMSHELRTPLNAIINFTYLLEIGAEGEVNPGQLDMLGRVETAGHHLLELVNDVLDLAKIEAGKLELSMEEFDLPGLFAEILPTVQLSLKDKPIVLIDAVREDFPAIRADRKRIRQVLVNLLSNAVKFTERGHIRIEAESTDDSVEIAVSDTGIGISEQDIARIFRDFVQVDGNMNRKTGGSGLGLAICRRFVELHGGTISAASAVGRGSRFGFTLPRRGNLRMGGQV